MTARGPDWLGGGENQNLQYVKERGRGGWSPQRSKSAGERSDPSPFKEYHGTGAGVFLPEEFKRGFLVAGENHRGCALAAFGVFAYFRGMIPPAIVVQLDLVASSPRAKTAPNRIESPESSALIKVMHTL